MVHDRPVVPVHRSGERDRDFHGFLAQRLQPFIAATEQVFNLYISGSRNCSIVDGLRFRLGAGNRTFHVGTNPTHRFRELMLDALVALASRKRGSSSKSTSGRIWPVMFAFR